MLFAGCSQITGAVHAEEGSIAHFPKLPKPIQQAMTAGAGIAYPPGAFRENLQGTSQCAIFLLPSGIVESAKCTGAPDILNKASERYFVRGTHKVNTAMLAGLPLPGWFEVDSLTFIIPK